MGASDYFWLFVTGMQRLEVNNHVIVAEDEDVGTVVQAECGTDYVITWDHQLHCKIWMPFCSHDTVYTDYDNLLNLPDTREATKRKRGRPCKKGEPTGNQKDMTEYNIFLKNKLPILKEKYPDMTNTDRMRIASDLWQAQEKC
jgi:hypothetical protein